MEMAAKRCYGTDETIAFILQPGSDSEMAGLENSNDETDETYILPELENESDCDEVSNKGYSCRRIDQSKDNKNDYDENNNTEKVTDSQNVAEKVSKPKIKKKHPDHKWCWREKKPPAGNTEFCGNQFGNPPINFYEMCPIDFFKLFWTDNVTQNLVEQTNLYSVQEQGKNISTCAKETEQFLSMYILMFIIKLPDYNLYWAAETGYSKIADVMSNKQFSSNCENIFMLLEILQRINQEIKMKNFSKYVLLSKQLDKIAWP